MGNEDNVSAAEEALQQQNNNNNNNMLRKRSGASSTSLQNQNTTSLQGGAGVGGAGGGAGSPMAGTALGRRLSASAHTASNTANNTGSNTADSGRAPQDGDLGNEEQDLLRQPLIQATGGISGLGAKQLSDNDNFSVVVKYLLDYDRFREVSCCLTFSSMFSDTYFTFLLFCSCCHKFLVYLVMTAKPTWSFSLPCHIYC